MTDKQQVFFKAIPDSWQKPLFNICQNKQIAKLIEFIQAREQAGVQIYPSKQNIFAALSATDFDKVKVVIVGQDPYHGPNQAHGLSFSVPTGVAIPPSLRNIFKELSNDIGPVSKKNYGNLTNWAQQDVLLLNAILTVEDSKPAAHAGQGWELFTDEIIAALLKRNQPLVLMLWGAYAQKKIANLHTPIDPSQTLVLKAMHPSPLSVRGFLGCRHFSQANAFLKLHNLPQIDWLNL